jgi:hypothetical protein
MNNPKTGRIVNEVTKNSPPISSKMDPNTSSLTLSQKHNGILLSFLCTHLDNPHREPVAHIDAFSSAEQRVFKRRLNNSGACTLTCAARVYFTIRSFVTDLTPWTLRAISPALSTAFWELTNPLS